MMMEKEKDPQTAFANRVLVAGGLTLTVFSLVNILKTAYPGIENLLTLYEPIGPLLGIYLISTLSFFFFLSTLKIESQRRAYQLYIISIILFVLLVFPPIFEAIAQLLGGS
jgi:hypothetical protein